MRSAYVTDKGELFVSLYAEQMLYKIIHIDDDAVGQESSYSLVKSTIERLSSYLLNMTNVNTICISFRGIIFFQNNADHSFNELLKDLSKKKIDIILLDLNEVKGFNASLQDLKTKTMGKHTIVSIAPSKHRKNLNNSERILIDKMYEELLLKYTVKDGHKNPFSPVIIDRYINVKKMLVDENPMPICIADLAMKITNTISKQSIQKRQLNQPTLFCHSMAGSFLASLIGASLGLDLLFVDHLGPEKDIVSVNFSNRIKHGHEYIIVTDVVCLGTEIESAMSYINLNGGKVKCVATMFRIDTIGILPNYNLVYGYEINSKRNIIGYNVRTLL